MFRVSDSQSRGFVGSTLSCNNSGKFVHMHLLSPSSIIWHSQKADVGKAGPMLHWPWPCITDSVLYLSTSSVAYDMEMSTMSTVIQHQNKNFYSGHYIIANWPRFIEHITKTLCCVCSI